MCFLAMRAAGVLYVMEKHKKIQDPEIEWESKHRKNRNRSTCSSRNTSEMNRALLSYLSCHLLVQGGYSSSNTVLTTCLITHVPTGHPTRKLSSQVILSCVGLTVKTIMVPSQTSSASTGKSSPNRQQTRVTHMPTCNKSTVCSTKSSQSYESGTPCTFVKSLSRKQNNPVFSILNMLPRSLQVPWNFY